MSRRRTVAAAIALTLASTAQAQLRDSVTIPLPGPRILHGFVADNVERPLDSVEVYIESLKRTTFTRPDGSFRFEDVKEGKYQLRARKLGYYPNARTVTVGDQGGATAFWLLPRGPVTLPTVIASATRGGLTGIIGDTSFRVIAGATIEGLAVNARTQSDSAGKFYLDLKPGEHMIRVSLPGYGSKMISVTIPRDSGREVSVWLAPGRGYAREAVAFMELEMRLTRRNPVWSKIYSREDIVRSGKKDLHELAVAGAGRPVDENACEAVIDGGPLRLPVWALEASEIDMVEIYTPRPPRQVPTSIMRGQPRRAPAFSGCPQVYAWLRK
jgi:hypothetical protein